MAMLRKGLIVLGITVALYILVDLAVGAILGQPHPAIPDFNLIPALYRQPYVSPDFAVEYVRNDFLEAVPGERLMWEPLRQGHYFNVEALSPTGAHYRRTANPPTGGRPTITILFLGASQVYGTEVPDDLTIPSLLSRRLGVLDPTHAYVVYNAGVQSVGSAQELWRLQYELAHGLKPDIVLLQGGGLDVVRGVYQATPGVPSALGHGTIGQLFHDYFPLNIYRWLRVWASGAITGAGRRKPPAHLADPERLAQLIRLTVDDYRTDQRQMATLAATHGARFITVLDPNLYSEPFLHPSADYAYADGLCARHSPGLADAIRAAWPAMTQALHELSGQGLETLDLSQAFRDKTADIFVDCDHFNAIGNAILAERLATAVLTRPASG
jgi:lysophospholipase L1-like esterase